MLLRKLQGQRHVRLTAQSAGLGASILLAGCIAQPRSTPVVQRARDVAVPAPVGAPPSSPDVVVHVSADKDVAHADPSLLVATNVAAWDSADLFKDEFWRARLRDLGPTLLRMPGGSWGDALLWNGNGVRHGNDVDWSRRDPKPYSKWSAPYGTWRIDYSDFAPGFMLTNKFGDTKWHGHVDVKTLHEFVRDTGNQAYVIVNGGLGSPRDAAEWVRWANQKMHYGVKYWEVGNELGGSWEAGHFLPNGRELDGATFAHRYAEFATAMKAVDPSIHVGCMDWPEQVLAQAGNLVDFISIHTYPVSGGEDDDALYKKLDIAAREIEPVRTLIHKYQPAREKQIEVGYSEWNMGWPDNRGALWHAAWIGELYAHGVTFALQFDAPGLVTPQHDEKWNLVAGKPPFTKSTYWAAWLWRHTMGRTLVETKSSGDPHVRVYATRSDQGLDVMLLNTDRDVPHIARLEYDGFTPGGSTGIVEFSRAQYFWRNERSGAKAGEMTNAPLWDVGPQSRLADLRGDSAFALPPDSITVLRIPKLGAEPPPAVAPVVASQAIAPFTPGLQLAVPDTIYDGDTVEVWATARAQTPSGIVARPLADGAIQIKGPLTSDRTAVRLAEGAGRFRVTAHSGGKAVVTVTSGSEHASHAVEIVASVPRPRIFWEFETDPFEHLRTQYRLFPDASVRANQRVARIDIDDDPSKSKKREILVIEQLPGRDRVLKENVRGVVFDLKLASGFSSADPDAALVVVMQSPRNYWMQLGRIPLRGHADFVHHELVTDDAGLITAMPEIYNLWFVLEAHGKVHGSVVLDSVGLMVR